MVNMLLVTLAIMYLTLTLSADVCWGYLANEAIITNIKRGEAVVAELESLLRRSSVAPSRKV